MNHLPKREGVGSLPLVSDTNLYPIIELAYNVKIAYLRKWKTQITDYQLFIVLWKKCQPLHKIP